MPEQCGRFLRIPLPCGLEALALTVRCCAHHAALLTASGYDTWRVAPGESLVITRTADAWLVTQQAVPSEGV